MKKSPFQQKYGPWGIIAGGALGIGKAYAVYLAEKGINLILIDNNQEGLVETS